MCFDLSITPNRGDCLSIHGLAREIKALTKSPVLKTLSVEDDVGESTTGRLGIRLEAPEQCPLYRGSVLQNIDNSGSSPLWMQERLRRCGVRPISPVVDITNYVMLEYGQPMHSFDYERIEGDICVRLAHQGEKLTLLDDSEQNLTLDTLVIADDKSAVAMAGIMGGKRTAVTADTQAVLLESAYFTSTAITGRARAYGLQTDASYRFERGVDYHLCSTAMARAIELLVEFAGAQVVETCAGVARQHLPQQKNLSLREQRLTSLLGVSIASNTIADILQDLGMSAKVDAKGHWSVAVPTYRSDINVEVDLIEEIARIYGYGNIPSSPPQIAQHKPQQDATTVVRRDTSSDDLRNTLIARGYHEAISYSFIAPRAAQWFSDADNLITLLHPLSNDMSVMRPSLFPGLLQSMSHNLHHQQSRVRLFELGHCFHATANQAQSEELRLAGCITGDALPTHWTVQPPPSDFFALKGDLQAVLALTGQEEDFSFVATERKYFSMAAQLCYQQQAIGLLGEFTPQVLAGFDIDQPTYGFDIAVESLQNFNLPDFSELSKFPQVHRDIALVVERSIPVAEIISQAVTAGGKLLQSVAVFDVFALPEKTTHSVGLRLTLGSHERTLDEKTINATVDKVVLTLQQNFAAQLRDF